MKGFVYLIYDISQDSYKIGVTQGDVKKRKKKLQTGNSTELHIVYKHVTEYPFLLERMLHNKYKNSNILNEWFTLTDAQVLNFKTTCYELEQTIQVLKENPFFQKYLK